MGAVIVDPAQLLGLAALGIGAGLLLFARGLLAYRRGSLVETISTSRIASIAAGEVRITGTVRPGPVTLVSPLQSRTCVYYRSRVVAHRGRETVTLLDRRRGVAFAVDDGSGTIRVLPGGASWDVPDAFHERDGVMGDSPPGLALNDGSDTSTSTGDGPQTAAEREAAIARLLSVHTTPRLADSAAAALAPGDTAMAILGDGVPLSSSGREYTEIRLEPGQTVTVVGTARPFADVPDPANDDAGEGPLAATDDPEIAADLAAARAAGTLQTDPASAWGNAAIEGFGIGRPVRVPTLDAAAHPEEIAPAAEEAAAHARFDISPDALVLAAGPGTPLAIFAGSPGEAAGRADSAFLLGLLGALLAIASAVAFALIATGTV